MPSGAAMPASPHNGVAAGHKDDDGAAAENAAAAGVGGHGAQVSPEEETREAADKEDVKRSKANDDAGNADAGNADDDNKADNEPTASLKPKKTSKKSKNNKPTPAATGASRNRTWTNEEYVSLVLHVEREGPVKWASAVEGRAGSLSGKAWG